MGITRHNWKVVPLLAIFAVLMFNGGATQASIYLFTGSGANAGDPGSAEFTFNSILDKVTIKLTNTATTTDDAADYLTGVQFGLGGSNTTGSPMT
jgi:hypothetical protein